MSGSVKDRRLPDHFDHDQDASILDAGVLIRPEVYVMRIIRKAGAAMDHSRTLGRLPNGAGYVRIPTAARSIKREGCVERITCK